MCREDWHTVPRSLQRDVNRSWRDFNAANAPAKKLESLAAYRRAVAAAVAAVEAARP